MTTLWHTHSTTQLDMSLKALFFTGYTFIDTTIQISSGNCQ